MKKIMNKIAEAKNNFEQKTVVGYLNFKQKAACVLTQNDGEGFVDTALKILISVVVGALLLAGLYLLFEDTILPTLTQRIKDLFDYKG